MQEAVQLIPLLNFKANERYERKEMKYNCVDLSTSHIAH